VACGAGGKSRRASGSTTVVDYVGYETTGLELEIEDITPRDDIHRLMDA
jgi:hypothetical protein